MMRELLVPSVSIGTSFTPTPAIHNDCLQFVPKMIGGPLVLFVSIGFSFTHTPAIHNNCPTDCTSNDGGLLVLFVSIGSSLTSTSAIHNNSFTDFTSNDEMTACSVCKYWFFFDPYFCHSQQLFYRLYLK